MDIFLLSDLNFKSRFDLFVLWYLAHLVLITKMKIKNQFGLLKDDSVITCKSLDTGHWIFLGVPLSIQVLKYVK